MVCQAMVCYFSAARLLDSPNCRYTMLIYKLEGYFGRLADSNYCVTRAMKDDLKAAWGIEANTFYDRPPAFRFRKVTDLEKHRLFQKLATFENGKMFRDKNGLFGVTKRIQCIHITQGMQIRQPSQSALQTRMQCNGGVTDLCWLCLRPVGLQMRISRFCCRQSTLTTSTRALPEASESFRFRICYFK